ncbi:MAG TPA: hypothetical protein VF599_08735 [Pyrinomonadaceae bacterium]|jgi:hypothetical protein
MRKIVGFLFIFVCFCASAAGCYSSKSEYVWSEITAKAAYPPGYGYPVFVMNGEMRALFGDGWVSKDGKNWSKTGLPNVGLNPAYQKYVLFKNAIYALGTMQGNYTNMKLTSKISRTRDFKTWETLAEKSGLPERVFYGAVVFKDKIWLVGGWDGKNYHNDVWNSDDGVNWQRAAEKTAWTPRTARVIVFKDRIWLIGGGVIDGDKTDNPNAGREVWSSTDGINWTPEKINSPGQIGGTPIVFDDKLWLIGANRNDGNFDRALYVSADGVNWQRESAPWSPRGAVAAWVSGDKLYMTGGKFSYTEPVSGEIKFVYSNDVWAMTRKTE